MQAQEQCLKTQASKSDIPAIIDTVLDRQCRLSTLLLKLNADKENIDSIACTLFFLDNIELKEQCQKLCSNKPLGTIHKLHNTILGIFRAPSLLSETPLCLTLMPLAIPEDNPLPPLIMLRTL